MLFCIFLLGCDKENDTSLETSDTSIPNVSEDIYDDTSSDDDFLDKSLSNYETITLSDCTGTETKQIGNDSAGYINVATDMQEEEVNEKEISVYDDFSIVAMNSLEDTGISLSDALEQLQKILPKDADIKQTTISFNEESLQVLVAITDKNEESVYNATLVRGDRAYFFYSSSDTADKAEKNLSIALSGFKPAD